MVSVMNHPTSMSDNNEIINSIDRFLAKPLYAIDEESDDRKGKK
jgi:hypothetical protein